MIYLLFDVVLCVVNKHSNTEIEEHREIKWGRKHMNKIIFFIAGEHNADLNWGLSSAV